MAPLKQTAFRLDAEDFEILDAVKRRTGLAARSDALRYVLRQYAQEHEIGEWGAGSKPTKAAKPKRRPK
jgi:hypothetical protein